MTNRGLKAFGAAFAAAGLMMMTTSAHADVKCRSTLSKESAKLTQSIAKILQKCEQSIEDGRALNADALRLSIPALVIERGKPFELLLVPRLPLAAIDGALMLQRLDESGNPSTGPVEPLPVSYQGAPVSTLRLVMPALAQAGLYRLSFDGQPQGTTDVKFAVVDFAAATESKA